MTKPQAKSPCHFHFIDEPQFRSQDSREHVARLLRAYRAHPKRTKIERKAPGLYMIRAIGTDAVACIETR